MKFHDIYRAGTVGIFLWNKLTSLNWLKFHMFYKFDEIRWILKKMLKFHVSDDDSNHMHVSANKFWWNLVNFEKMLKFHDIYRAGTVGFFLWNKLTSLNWLKFHMHVSDDDSNMFWKFDEIWWTLKKIWNLIIFLGPALSAFFFDKI